LVALLKIGAENAVETWVKPRGKLGRVGRNDTIVYDCYLRRHSLKS
jgi:hypothetical protein